MRTSPQDDIPHTVHLAGLVEPLRRHPAFRALREGHPREPLGLLGAARPLVVAALAQEHPGPILVLTDTREQAQRWTHLLRGYLPRTEADRRPLLHFPPPEALPYERILWADGTRQERLTVLATLAVQGQDSRPVVVASVAALLQVTLPARELRLAMRPLRAGTFVELDALLRSWVEMGYERTQVVELPGTFARRGGIVDVWPPNLPHPVRIDLFGDQVESLRIFDPATQRTVQAVDRVDIGPGSEALPGHGPRALERLGHGTPDCVLDDPELLLAIREEIAVEVDALSQGRPFRGMEWYLPYLYARPATLLDYLGPDALVVVDDAMDLRAEMEAAQATAQRTYQELRRGGEVPARFRSSHAEVSTLLATLEQRHPLLLGFGNLDGSTPSESGELARAFAPAPRYAGKTRVLLRDLDKFLRRGEPVVLVSQQAARLQAELGEADRVPAYREELAAGPSPGITLLSGSHPEGFVLRGGDPGAGFVLLTDNELFGWEKASTAPSRTARSPSKVAPELFFADVKPGDYVVHIEHGIGRYEGLVKLELDGVPREYLRIAYAHGDRLYVPVHQADRLSRYVGPGEGNRPPVVTRLGTADWQLTKARARRAVEEMAEELLALYAERMVVEGHAFSPDGPWQEELEASFPYPETPDQLRTIQEVKRDMEAPRPMDRIVIGDVGYGKTEVAIRAAFKAVMDGKQVAVLVPTTVLAQQHYRTFSQRLARFPVAVEMLSRFRTPAQQRRILQGLAQGTVDIVIGTHRLLSPDVAFKDLGLLIVDEEQRFGVAHKERLKQLRTQVDVLTLSATPIPRTLHMSLSGVRDMSTITTPPQERQPVRTILSEYDEVLIRQAIQRELDRGGQVFFVHNRVQGLEMLAKRIQRLVPEARVAVAHGQMAERELERVMLAFAEGEIDVLVCTTIVENGLDIRRANTMIVNRADHFGLAQLYQLRGRVGRGAVRGYCYLLYERHKSLSFDARRRLEALLESSETLGAGFRIAMRDLEIRGAGELLGTRQHGQIAAVGFDLYTRLLAQAVNELREKRRERPPGEDGHADTGPEAPEGAQDLPFSLENPLAPPITLDLPVTAEIPEAYVGDPDLRLQLYRRIAGLTTEAEIQEMRQELVDRFGKDPETGTVPQPVEGLLYQIRVKNLALRAAVPKIGRRRDQIAIYWAGLTEDNRRDLQHRLRTRLGHMDPDQGRWVPATEIHVGKEAIYIPVDAQGRWQETLVRTLSLLAGDFAAEVPADVPAAERESVG